MAAAHPTSQAYAPDSVIWCWTGEPELVLENGDRLYSACTRPKEEGDYADGGAGTSAVRDKVDLLEVGECFGVKIKAYAYHAVGVITRLSEKADCEGELCSKIVTYKPFFKLNRLPIRGANFTKCSLMETVATMNLTGDEALFLSSNERQTYLKDCTFPVTVHNAILYQQFCAPKSENPTTGGSKASKDHDAQSFCCVGLYNHPKRRVKLLLDEDFFLKDYLLPEVNFSSPNEEEDESDDNDDEFEELMMALHAIQEIVIEVNMNE